MNYPDDDSCEGGSPFDLLFLAGVAAITLFGMDVCGKYYQKSFVHKWLSEKANHERQDRNEQALMRMAEQDAKIRAGRLQLENEHNGAHSNLITGQKFCDVLNPLPGASSTRAYECCKCSQTESSYEVDCKSGCQYMGPNVPYWVENIKSKFGVWRRYNYTNCGVNPGLVLKINGKQVYHRSKVVYHRNR